MERVIIMESQEAKSLRPPLTQEQLLQAMGALWDMQPSRNEMSSEDLLRLAEARQAFRAGDLLLTCTLLRDLRCPEAANLRGVVYEMLGDSEGARQCYQAALKVDRYLSAAEINLRRSYELWAFGRSDIPYAL